MGEWQEDELKAATEMVVVLALHADKVRQEPTAAAGDRWQAELGFTADVIVMDYGRRITDLYQDANASAGRMTQAVRVFIDKTMKIRFVGSTYDVDPAGDLATLQELLAE